MTHPEVFKQFTKDFPHYMGMISAWFPNGKNSIRLRRTEGDDVIFTYNSDRDWCLETVDHFIEHLKRRKTECG